MSMHIRMHVCVCMAMHNPIQMNDQFLFFFVQLVKGWEEYQEFPCSAENLSFSISPNLSDVPLSLLLSTSWSYGWGN